MFRLARQAKTRELINRVTRQNVSTLMFTHKLVCANLTRNFHNHLADDSHRTARFSQ